MCSIINQSAVRKSDQSEVTISGQLANQNPGKRTNQKAGYKKEQPMNSINTKSSIWRIYDQITNQSPARKSDQWDDRIQYPATNQKPGKRTNQKRGDFFYVRVRTIYTVTESSMVFRFFWQTMTRFTCEKCGKEFTEKRSLLRHMKIHLKDPTVSGQTYSCIICDKEFTTVSRQIYSFSICDKEFSRPDNRKRHEATHG